jgi:hypothetical protein
VGRAGAVPYADRSQVRFPEPRGPNRKKLCLGGVRMRLNSVVWFAVILRRFLTAIHSRVSSLPRWYSFRGATFRDIQDLPKPAPYLIRGHLSEAWS